MLYKLFFEPESFSAMMFSAHFSVNVNDENWKNILDSKVKIIKCLKL